MTTTQSILAIRTSSFGLDSSTNLLTKSHNDSSTPTLSELTVHQHTLPLRQPPLNHIAHGLKHSEQVFRFNVCLNDMDLRDPCYSIRVAHGGRETSFFDREDKGYILGAELFGILSRS